MSLSREPTLEIHKCLLLLNLAILGPKQLSLCSIRVYSFSSWVFRHTPMKSKSDFACVVVRLLLLSDGSLDVCVSGLVLIKFLRSI